MGELTEGINLTGFVLTIMAGPLEHDRIVRNEQFAEFGDISIGLYGTANGPTGIISGNN